MPIIGDVAFGIITFDAESEALIPYTQYFKNLRTLLAAGHHGNKVLVEMEN
jgi:hypothetical protein